jgi:hypothetical protein
MNNQARLRLAGVDGFKNPVKRNNNKIDFIRRQLQPELQREKGAGHGPRHGDFRFGQIDPAQ